MTMPEAMTDVVCARPGGAAEGGSQDLSLEQLVSHLRHEGLKVEVAGYPDRAGQARELAEVLAAATARCIVWPVSGRADWRRLIDNWPSSPPGPDGEMDDPVTLVCGDFPSRHAAGALEALPGLSAVVRGEPEATVAAVGSALRRGRPWRQEKGLTVTENGSPRFNPPRPLLRTLDSLAAHSRDFFHPSRRGGTQRILLSRGCASDCQYCGLQTPYRREWPGIEVLYWRSRSASAVVEEMMAFHRLGVRNFSFNSFVTFGVDERGGALLADIARGILESGLDMEFRFVTLVRDLHRNLELLPLLRDAGLREVTLGVDSGVPRVLETFGVDSSPRRVHESMAALAENGVAWHTGFVFYDPYLTLGEMRQNLSFIRSLAPHYRAVGIPFAYAVDQQYLSTSLRVLWSTPLYPRLVEDGLAEEVDLLERDPRVGVRHPAVGRLLQVHTAINQSVMPFLRPFLSRRKAVEQHPWLETFPLDLVEFLVSCYEAELERPPKQVLEQANRWIHSRLSSGWDSLVELLEVSEEEREKMDRFLATLTRTAA